MVNVINTTKLETVISQRWTEFVDKTQLMRAVLEHVRDGEYRTSDKAPPNPNHTVSLSFHSSSNKLYEIEMWAEFTAPKDNGVVVGTHVFAVLSNGDIKLKETYGTHFLHQKH